jgi:hypothetical protein
VDINDPSALAAELEKHEGYVALVEAGIAACSASELQAHIQYVAELKAHLMAITDGEDLIDLRWMDDAELLAMLAE